MKKISFIALFLAISIALFAQISERQLKRALKYVGKMQTDPKLKESNSRLEDMKNRNLVVALYETKKADQQADVAALNDRLKTVVEQYLVTYPKSKIEFKTKSEIKALKKADATKYAILEIVLVLGLSGNIVASPVNYWTKKSKDRYAHEISKGAYLTLAPLEYSKPQGADFFFSRSYVSGPFTLAYPSKGDLILNMKIFNVGLDTNLNATTFYQAVSNLSIYNVYAGNETYYKNVATQLKSKTLLIDKQDLAENLTEADIKAIYRYNFKLVEYSEIEKAIVEANPTNLAIQIIPSRTATALSNRMGNNQTMYYEGFLANIYSMEKNDFLATNIPNNKLGKTLTKKHFEELQKLADYK